MFHSDMEILRVAEEQQKDLIKAAERQRRTRHCKISRRSKLRLRVGNSLIVLGERLKGDI